MRKGVDIVMKKKLIGLLLIVFVLGAASMAFAQVTAEEGFFSFQEMLPFMQQMHPDWSETELKSMFDACHGGGESGSATGMMNGGGMGGMMGF
ncbi:MAG: hypothetical protein SCK28_11710 [Bacillota bacterium]|nr:hypothetical protein [Bacillota bacterium]